MPFGLRLWLVLLIAGCAESALLVPESDWNTVPLAQRAAIDQAHEKELAAARAEVAAASANLAAMPRTPPAPPRATAAPAENLAPGDPWAEVLRDRERARGEARGRVETAIAEVRRTDLAWRQLWVETAEARLAVVVSQRELVRGQAVNRNMRGEDTYDTAPLRGQFSRAQQRWYALANQARTSRDAFEHASADLASYKEAYAQLMRGLPMRVVEPDVTDDHDAKLTLTGWSISRSDIRRRRGLRHFLDDAIAMQQLRRTTYLLRPIGRMPTVVAAAAPPSSLAQSAPSSAAPGAPPPQGETPRPAAAPALDHPADRAGAAPPTAVATSKAAAPRRTAPKPTTPSTPAPVEHPADRAAPQPTATAAALGKPDAPRGATPAATASARAEPATAPSPPAPAAPGATKPIPSRSGSQTGVAKPIERPPSDADSHLR
jgi:hypothetical protein